MYNLFGYISKYLIHVFNESETKCLLTFYFEKQNINIRLRVRKLICFGNSCPITTNQNLWFDLQSLKIFWSFIIRSKLCEAWTFESNLFEKSVLLFSLIK